MKMLRAEIFIGTIIFVVLVIIGWTMPASPAAAATTLYSAPSGANISGAYSLKVNGNSSPVYFTGKLHAHYAYFDTSDSSVTIQVTSPTANYWVNGVSITPRSRGISATISGSNNVATFTVSQAGQYIVERSDLGYTDPNNEVLVIAVNPIQSSIPSPTDPNVIYYQAGLYNTNSISVAAGKTLYVAGGAVVNVSGNVQLSGTGANIQGRGILNITSPTNTVHLLVSSANNGGIDGVMMASLDDNSNSFLLDVADTSTFTINNYKTFGHVFNNDGVDMGGQSDDHITVSNSFIRSYDDCFAIYANVDTLVYTNNICWPLVSGVMRLGDGSPLDGITITIRNVTFENSEIVHMGDGSQTYGFLVDLRQTNDGNIKDDFENIVFQNINMTDTDMFINMSDGPTNSSAIYRGWQFSNIQIANTPIFTSTAYAAWCYYCAGPVQIDPGFSLLNATDIDTIQFNNVSIAGKVAASISDIGVAQLRGGLATNPQKVIFTGGGGSGTVSVEDSVAGTGTNQFDYHGSWSSATGVSGYSLGSEHYSNVTSDYALFRFSGTRVQFYAGKNSDNGKVGCTIDSNAETIADLYASGSGSGNQLVCDSGVLASGSHTLKIRVAGTKNAAANDYYVAVDRAIVTP